MIIDNQPLLSHQGDIHLYLLSNQVSLLCQTVFVQL